VVGDVLGEVLQHETDEGGGVRGRFIRPEEARRHSSPRGAVDGGGGSKSSSGGGTLVDQSEKEVEEGVRWCSRQVWKGEWGRGRKRAVEMGATPF
jgi:hypothetical protein